MPDSTAPVPAVSVALLCGDQVLLVKRGHAPSKGLYAFPGGRVEAGETLEQAAVRELMEETGLGCGPLSPVEVIDTDRDGAPLAFRLHVFTASWVGGEPVAGDDADEADWRDLGQMRQMPVIPSVLAVAERLLLGGA